MPFLLGHFFVLNVSHTVSKDAFSATSVIKTWKLHLHGAVALCYVLILMALAHLNIATFILNDLADALHGVVLHLGHIVLEAAT